MASCIISVNKTGRVDYARTPDGKTSVLFDELAGIPHVGVEDAVKAFKHAYSSFFKGHEWYSANPRNAGAVSEVKKKMDSLGVKDDNLIKHANSMHNPVLVRRFEFKDGNPSGNVFYTTDLRTGDHVELVDMQVEDVMDLTGANRSELDFIDFFGNIKKAASANVVRLKGDFGRFAKRAKKSDSRNIARTSNRIDSIAEIAERNNFKTNDNPVSFEEMKKSASSLSDALDTNISVVRDATTITHDDAKEQRRRRGSKVFYDNESGELYVVSKNITSVSDLHKAVLSEISGSKGLKSILGEKFSSLMDSIYDYLPQESKTKIDESIVTDKASAVERFTTSTDALNSVDTIAAISDSVRSFLKAESGMDVAVTDGNIISMFLSSSSGLRNEIFDTRELFHIDSNVPRVGFGQSQPSDANRFNYKTGEPIVFFRVGDKLYSNYADALSENKANEIEYGFVDGTFENTIGAGRYESKADVSEAVYGVYTLNNKDAFHVVGSVDARTEGESSVAITNGLIKSGLISGEKVPVRTINGIEYKYKGHSTIKTEAIMRSQMAVWENPGRVIADEYGYVEVLEPEDNTVIPQPNGNPVSMDAAHAAFAKGGVTELSKIVEEPVAVASHLIIDKHGLGGRKRTQNQIRTAESEVSNLRSSMMNILESLGVRISGIKEWAEKRGIKFGDELDVNGVADLANNIIALSDNASDLVLAEETAHFLIESYPYQSEIDSLLDEVRETDEYAQMSDNYRTIYSDRFQGQELEDVVAREVLGHILANEFNNRFSKESKAQENTFYQKIIDLVNRIKEFLGIRVNDEFKSNVDSLVSKIADLAIESPEVFDKNLLKAKDWQMYSAEATRIADRLDAHRISLKNSIYQLSKLNYEHINGLKNSSSTMDSNFSKLLNDQNELNSTMVEGFVNGVIASGESHASNLVKIRRKYQKAKENGAPYINIEAAENTQVTLGTESIAPILRDMSSFVNSNWSKMGISREKAASLKRKLDENAVKISGELIQIQDLMVDNPGGAIEAILRENGETNEDLIEKTVERVEGTQRDCWSITRMFGTIDNSSNPLIVSLAKLVSNIRLEAHINSIAQINDFLDRVQEEGWRHGDFMKLTEKYEDGTETSMLQSEVSFAKFTDALVAHQIESAKKLYPELAEMGTTEELVKLVRDEDIILHPELKNRLRAFSNAHPELLSGTDLEIYRAAKKKDFTFSYKNAIGETVEEKVTAPKQAFRPSLENRYYNFMSDEDSLSFRKDMREWNMDNNEMKFDKEYYKIRQGIYDSVPASEESKDIYQRYVSDMGAVKYNKKFRDPKTGKPNLRAYLADEEAVARVNEIRLNMKRSISTRDETGRAKTGEDLRLALELRAIKEAWTKYYESNNVKTKVLSKDFMDELSRIQRDEGSAAAGKFLRNNAYLSFNDNFWENFDTPYLEKVQAIANMVQNLSLRADIELMIEDYKDASEALTEVIRQLRVPGYPGQMNPDIKESDKDTILSLSTRVEGIRDNIYRAISAAEKDQKEDILDLLSGLMNDDINFAVNNVYKKELDEALKDQVVGSEYEFIEKAIMATNDQRGVIRRWNNAKSSLEKLKDKKRNNAGFARDFKRIFSKYAAGRFGLDTEEMLPLVLDEDNADDFTAMLREQLTDFEEVMNEYGRSLLPRYYKSVAPTMFSSFDEQLDTGMDVIGNPIDMVKLATDLMEHKDDTYRYLTLDPDNAWYDNDETLFEKYLNPNFKEDNPYGYYQPKMSLYKNQAFFDKFGMTLDGRATRNLKEYDMIQMLVDKKRQINENYHTQDPHEMNLYYIPQSSKTTEERLFTNDGTSLKERAKNQIRDVYMNRVDDPLYGQTLNLDVKDGTISETSAKVLPKLGYRRLMSRNDVSYDFAKTYSSMLSNSALYHEKMKNMSKVLNLQALVRNQNYHKRTKGEVTQMSKMMDEFINSYFYGQRLNTDFSVDVRGKRINIGKVLMGLEQYYRHVNLMYSAPVALTSTANGHLNLEIEGLAKQYFSSESHNYARAEYVKMMPGYAAEVGKIKRDNPLYVKGEYMGIYRVMHRARSASFNRILRTGFDNFGYELMGVTNAPLAPRVMLAILDDMRYVDGTVLSSKDFYNKRRKEGVEKSTMEIEWRGLREKSLNNLMGVENGAVKLSEDINADVLKQGIANAASKIMHVNGLIEGIVPQDLKSMASRHAGLSFMLGHRGWFQMWFQKRWKSHQINFMTGLEEEGTNRTFLRLIGNTLSGLNSQGAEVKRMEALRDNFSNLNEYEKANMNRMLFDLMVIGLGIAGMALFSGWAGDDDNKENWIVQMGCLIGLRTINEMFSQTPIFMEANITDMIQNPVVMSRKYTDLVTLGFMIFNGTALDEIQTGAYKGETQLYRRMISQTFLKQWYQINNPENVNRTARSYAMYNNNTLIWSDFRTDDEKAKEDNVTASEWATGR